MVLRIKNVKVDDSILIESNFIETQSGAYVCAFFDGSNVSLLQRLLGHIKSFLVGEGEFPEKPNGLGHYVSITEWGEVDIVPVEDGMYNILIDGLGNEKCNLEVYINDQRI